MSRARRIGPSLLEIIPFSDVWMLWFYGVIVRDGVIVYGWPY